MFDVTNNNIITISRGDVAETSLYINLGTELEPLNYELDENDRVYLGIMEPNQPFELALVKKVFTKEDFDFENHCLNIIFKSEDTEFLVPGNYYYEIKLFRPSAVLGGIDKVDTVVSKRRFIVI